MRDIEQIVYVSGSSKIAKDFKVGVIKAMFSYKCQIGIMSKVSSIELDFHSPIIFHSKVLN
jgi:hypothetical protein